MASAYTDYVRSSAWRNGTGDVFTELAAAGEGGQRRVGALPFSVGSREGTYGKTMEYNEFYIGQMTELLSRYSSGGDLHGLDWVPAECDVSIRSGLFWHASQLPKYAMTLLDIYYKSAGRNCLLLNVPPNSTGLIADEDIQVLKEFTNLRQSIFSNNLAWSAIVTASSVRRGVSSSQYDPQHVLQEGIYKYWLLRKIKSVGRYIWTLESISLNVLQVQEPIHMGQRIIKFHLDILTENGNWKTVDKWNYCWA